MFFRSVMWLLTCLLPLVPGQDPVGEEEEEVFDIFMEELGLEDPFAGLQIEDMDNWIQVYPTREDYLEELRRRDPEEQRQYLGERLYYKIEDIEHENVAKITGMLLELPRSRILDLLTSLVELKGAVKEAKDLLGDWPNGNLTVHDDSGSSSEDPAY